jgi:hypothetical protein
MWARIYLFSDTGRNIGANRDTTPNDDKVYLNLNTRLIVVNEVGITPYISSVEKLAGYNIGLFDKSIIPSIELESIGNPEIRKVEVAEKLGTKKADTKKNKKG